MVIYILLLITSVCYCLNKPYPLTRKILNKNKIHKFKVENNEFVVWWDKEKWSATSSVCEHRAADLSKGIITKQGNLKCGYHGWEYNHCGNCVFIPSDHKDANIKIKHYKIIDKHGILWIADQNQTNFVQELDKNYIQSLWFIDDVNLPNKLLLENAIDSLHFDHVHSDTPPPFNRYNPQKQYDSPTSKLNWYNETGFSCNVNDIEYTFFAPYTIVINFSNKFIIYAESLPIDDCNTRFTSTSFIVSNNKIINKITELSFLLFSPITRMLGNKILNQDVNQITGQYENIEKYGYKHTKLSCVDDPITYFNKWLNEFNL